MDTTSTTQQPSRRDWLLAVDPGLATGVVLLDITDTSDIKIEFAHEWDTDEFYNNIENVIEELRPAIVCERFLITAQTAKLSQAPWSLEMIGILRFLSSKYAVRLSFQDPAQKTFATNEKLRHVGFWYKGGGGHANDAYRHAMVYIVSHYPGWAKNLIL